MGANSPVVLRASRRHVKKVVQTIRSEREVFREHFKLQKKMSSFWWKFRGFSASRDFIKHFTGFDILKEMKQISQRKKEPVTILEDGPGWGNFSSELKRILTRLHIQNKITGLSLELDEELQKHAGVRIDRVLNGPGELFVPREKYDFIYSMFGSINYVHSSIQLDHMLKFLYSLNRGGVMVAGFDYKHLTLGSLKELVQEFEKRGFLVKVRDELHTQGYPEIMMVIRRPIRSVRFKP